MNPKLSLPILATLLLTACQTDTAAAGSPAPFDPKIHHAVLLQNGSVFFGQIERVTPDTLTLQNVFYVQTRAKADPAGTKETQNVLVRRGKEWHAPERMHVNRSQIVFIEPVTAGSTVARLILQAEK